MAESKVAGKPVYQPGASTIEGMPMALQMFCGHPPVMAMPHWHAQVEINYIMRGSVHYRLNHHDIRLEAGQMCLFWGGQPHRLDESSADSIYAGAHLPLVHFFRMRLPERISARLMKGDILLTSITDGADEANFPRWCDYARSGDPMRTQHAVDELLLRIERIALEDYTMVPGNTAGSAEQPHAQLSGSVVRICDFIAVNFLNDIDILEIARAVDLHPKYAMNLFKKMTGMTISKYINLLRLSHAQAKLMSESPNVLQIAMDSGFGSVSAFNKSFRNIAGMSPSDFRRDMRSAIGNISDPV